MKARTSLALRVAFSMTLQLAFLNHEWVSVNLTFFVVAEPLQMPL
jgi:hypothetical protein